MAKDPAFLFYPGDYISGTMYLNFECKGAYIDLLMLQFQKEHMTLHMIQHMLGHKYEDIWPHIKDKFVEKDGFYWNERLRKEKEIRVSYSESRSSNRKGRKDMNNHMSEHMLVHMEDEDINRNIITNTLHNKKEKEGNEIQKVALPFNGKFSGKWKDWKEYKSKEHRFKFKSEKSEEASLRSLVKLSNNREEIAIEIIEQSMAHGWAGFFELKNNLNGKQNKRIASSEIGKPGATIYEPL